MVSSLQEQLLKAGLIDQKKIDEAQKQKRQQATAKKSKGKKKAEAAEA